MSIEISCRSYFFSLAIAKIAASPALAAFLPLQLSLDCVPTSLSRVARQLLLLYASSTEGSKLMRNFIGAISNEQIMEDLIKSNFGVLESLLLQSINVISWPSTPEL